MSNIHGRALRAIVGHTLFAAYATEEGPRTVVSGNLTAEGADRLAWLLNRNPAVVRVQVMFPPVEEITKPTPKLVSPRLAEYAARVGIAVA